MSGGSVKINGFEFSAVKAGIKKSGALDLGLIISNTKASAACVLTTNKLKAAPILLCQDRIKSGNCKGIIVNSGCANASTGEDGLADAKAMTAYVAHTLNIDEDDILVASTGVIGEQLAMQKIKSAVPELCGSLSADKLDRFSTAIMTTDTYEKVSSRTITLDGKDVTVAGVAKGSGMIMPNMATMLGFIMTDAAVEHKHLSAILTECVNMTFNRVTVDSDTSTNDMVLFMANGESGAAEITKGSPDAETFFNAAKEVMYDLAVMMAKDGEGATKLIRITTKRAKTEADADSVSRSVANSPLVKTAFFAEDANVGRLMMAIGKSDATIYPNEIDIFINDIAIVKGSRVLTADNEDELSESLKGDTINVVIILNTGEAEAEILTCDLSYDYIKINSAYRT